MRMGIVEAQCGRTVDDSDVSTGASVLYMSKLQIIRHLPVVYGKVVWCGLHYMQSG